MGQYASLHGPMVGIIQDTMSGFDMLILKSQLRTDSSWLNILKQNHQYLHSQVMSMCTSTLGRRSPSPRRAHFG